MLVAVVVVTVLVVLQYLDNNESHVFTMIGRWDANDVVQTHLSHFW